MLNILSGLILIGVGGTGVWYFRPNNGVVHPLVKLPFFDSMVAIGIMCITAIGVALIGSAVLG